MSKNKPEGHELPQPYKYSETVPFHFTIGWRDRIKILFGYSMLCQVMIHSVQNPGAHRVTMKPRTTKVKVGTADIPEDEFPASYPMNRAKD